MSRIPRRPRLLAGAALAALLVLPALAAAPVSAAQPLVSQPHAPAAAWPGDAPLIAVQYRDWGPPRDAWGRPLPPPPPPRWRRDEWRWHDGPPPPPPRAYYMPPPPPYAYGPPRWAY